MKDGQKQYRILRIDEPDFGCEGRDDGEAAYDEITLVNEQGETCLVRMEEQQVWSMGINILDAALGVVLVWQLLPIGDDSGCQPLFDVPHDLQINGLSLRLDEALEVDQRSRLLSLQPYYMCNTVSNCIICIAQFVCQAYSCGILLRFYKTAPEDLTIPCYADTGRKMIVRKM